MPSIKCPVPGCGYVTEDLDVAVVAALLTLHNNVHSSPSTAKVEVKRPCILAASTRENWPSFKSRWSEYVDATKITGQEKVEQLLECCDEQLRRDLTTSLGGALTDKTEEELLAAIERLLVHEKRLTVPRESLHNLPRDSGASSDEQTGALTQTDNKGEAEPEKDEKPQNHHDMKVTQGVIERNISHKEVQNKDNSLLEIERKDVLEKKISRMEVAGQKLDKNSGGIEVCKHFVDSSDSDMEVSEEDTESGGFMVIHKADDVSPLEKQEELLGKLGLSKYVKGEKISLLDVVTQSSGKRDLMSDIPWHVFSKILMLDYRGRDDIISPAIENSLATDQTIQGPKKKATVDFEEMFAGDMDSTSLSSMPHPMDVLLALFMCSSNFLRQIICEKLFMCKLSIPLVIPSVLGEEPLSLLWSLRSTVAEFKLPSGDLYETSVVTHPIPIVSCLRVGEISRSKSKFLNEILNDQSHPTFFHRDCQNGMNGRILSEGVLEIAWYFPPKRHENIDLSRDLAFVNLRGDGESTRIAKSVEFLCKISSVVIVMIDVNGTGHSDKIDSLTSKFSHDTQLILLVTKQASTKFDETSKMRIKKLIDSLQCKGLPLENIVFDFDARGEKNIKHLKSKISALINMNLAVRTEEVSIEECMKLADSLKIGVDENTSECSKSKKMASSIIQGICKRGMDNLKAKNMPLQCQPWQEWAELHKEEHRRERRGNDSMDSYMDKIANDMRKLRQKQLRLIENPNIARDAFLDNLTDPVSEEILYFLRWLKLHLDEISRQTLPSLQKECSQKWNKIRECEDATQRAALQVELDESEKKLAEASFGLEHFMREIAQAYESVQYMGNEASAKTREQMQCLPSIMAELMLLGYPLEIMDGDAAHIPMKWVQAVLSQLTKRIGDKKIFVLSVLGIQSSGKSTLLNTMFGLQFAVAAGRCTRGVFAQLLPVCTEYSGTTYDYILVVDTEGLRAAELGKAKLQHDNEIATLVIGLGDITLVNVKGENVSEMEDVLQIVVHALLKMSLVNKNLKLQPSCIFIHQNVSAQDASQKLRTGQQRFIETLDKVTKAAGKQEDNPQYTRFRQLINFDINKDIFYISDLWKGDPPMAPVNPGYSENINNVKQKLMTDVMKKRSFHLTADKFCARLKDLWNGILDQNFVFSFKNSLEMDAYNSLESELSDILWSMKSSAMEWFNSKRNLISNRESELEKLSLDLTSECRQHLDKVYQEAVKRLDNYFITHEDRSFLEQWRANSALKLKASYSNKADSVIDNIRCEIEKRKIQIEQKKDMKAYINRIMTEAQELAENLRLQEGKSKLSEEELKDTFREKWNEWLKTIPQKEKEDLNVVEQINDTLERVFVQDLPLLKKVQEERCLETARENCVKAIETYATDRIYLSRNGFWNMLSKDKDVILKYLNEVIENVKAVVRDKQDKKNQINQECAQKIIRCVRETVKKLGSVLKCSNVNELEICLAIFLCQYASHPYSRISKLEPGPGKTYEVVAYGILPAFEQVLLKTFTHYKEVMKRVKPELMLQNSSRNFNFDIKKHTQMTKEKSKSVEQHVQPLIDNLFVDVQTITDKVQCFSEHSIEEIIHMVVSMESKCNDVSFTKTFRTELIVYLCQFCLPKFCEKQKRYVEDRDQRLVYERDNYGPCFERFKNFYFKFTDEQALANVLSERVAKAIENAVNIDVARTLAEDVRNNVSQLQLKPAFLKSVLSELLEVDEFREFHLYLSDLDESLQKWLCYYIDRYLFTQQTNEPNRYTTIASQKIEGLTSEVCNKILAEAPTEDENSFLMWIKDFHSRVKDILTLPLEDLLSLSEGYNIVSLKTFTKSFSEIVQKSQNVIKDTFRNHTPADHKDTQEDNVYNLIAAECKGCTERCPFCSAPCSLNTPGHTEGGVNHTALEHYPEACGRYRWKDSQKLVTESCTMLVAGDARFSCGATNGQYHPYKDYKEIYPHWEIHGDLSVEATPYWKWFLVQYEAQLAEVFEAERPDIPSSWRRITKDDALNSLEK
ncbi:interferon-induced very large GTPase 1-like isoform X1 [Macrobrachium nipponense]|uniref:interferon-induced very large GTPase 1-like isoform X1 n=2 Tax=Macrobrachium nipponense TaxID=159736 RepID=UPI0030C84101